MYGTLVSNHSRGSNLRLIVCTVGALLVGIALGAGVASPSVAKSAMAAPTGTQWSAYHAAIPAEAQPSAPSPTF
jgi:hypothetical protein